MFFFGVSTRGPYAGVGFRLGGGGHRRRTAKRRATARTVRTARPVVLPLTPVQRAAIVADSDRRCRLEMHRTAVGNVQHLPIDHPRRIACEQQLRNALTH